MIYPIKQKYDVSIIFPKFKNVVPNFFQKKIKFYFDNSGDFIKLKSFFETNSIS